jgi:hypothetical protein
VKKIIKPLKHNYKPLKLFIKSWRIGLKLHPSFDVSSPPSYCLQSHEMLLNKGIKYCDSRWNAPRLENIYNYSTHSSDWMIGWKRSWQERTWKIHFSTNFFVKMNFMLHWSLIYFFLVFWNLMIPYVTKQGVPFPFFLILQITLLSYMCFNIF